MKRIQTEWCQDYSVEEKWLVIRFALTKAAESVIGTESSCQPDWFRESEATVLPALQHRNQCYTKWLATRNPADLQKFQYARAEARRVVRAAKNTWFQTKAEEAQRGRFGGKVVWKCIKVIQSGRRGLVSTRSSCIRDDEGNYCTSLSVQHQQWHKHFTKVLNVGSPSDMQELENVNQCPVRQELAEKPSMAELKRAL